MQSDEVYGPREDTWLLLSALEGVDVVGKRVLDMGTGSGALAHACAGSGAEVLAVDIGLEAIVRTHEEARRRGLEIAVIRGDLSSSLAGRFDLVLFNPPYLPSRTISDRTVDGGRDGAMVIRRFLAELPDRLLPNGAALILLSSMNHSSLFKEFPNLHFEAVKKCSLWMEELTVFAVRPAHAA